MAISIHALVKRATTGNVNKGSQILISIHALVKRATKFFRLFFPSVYISIHALVKRATRQGLIRLMQNGYFNPRPRKEGDVYNIRV